MQVVYKSVPYKKACIGKILIIPCIYVWKDRMYRENNLKIYNRKRKGGPGAWPPEHLLIATPFRLLENVGNTFWA